jgi:hypothetical protein
MKEDEYYSSFEREGFVPPESSRALFQQMLPVDGKNPAHLDVELIPYARIRGRVVDADGKPRANIAVALDGLRAGLPVAETTDPDGNFTFNKLLPGSYMILARPKPAPSATKAGDDRTATVITWFPTALERAQATPVIVRAGADAPSVEIRLRRIPVFRVRGLVLDESGNPAPKITVSLHIRDAAPGSGDELMMGGARTWYPQAGPGPAIETAVTDSEGAFEFSSVREGDWVLRAESEWGYIEETKRDVQAVGGRFVSVSKKDVADVKVQLAANFELPIKVDYDDAPGATGGGLNVMLVPMDAGPAAIGIPTKDGTTVITRVYPGPYRVIAQTFRPGFYVASVDYQGREVAGPIAIAAGSPALHFVLRNHAGLVSGLIGTGQAATVLLLPSSNAEDDVLLSVECAPGGSFRFDNLRPGTYSIAAFERIDETKPGDRAFRERLLTTARSIKVEEGSNAPIELSVSVWPD